MASRHLSPKRQRLLFAFFGLAFLVAATLSVLKNFSDHIVFFYTPSDLRGKVLEPDRLIRLGGLVEEGSVTQESGNLSFTVTDLNDSFPVKFSGIPPALFREGQGVVAEGYREGEVFRATKLLAKHDENYMPPEVAEALRKSGRWQGSKP